MQRAPCLIRNEYFTIIGEFSYSPALVTGGIHRQAEYQ